ncbi:hypothetical protein [Primorskyibacter sp. 2E233]|uniref:hypothetical protein n=1 Tax=Primorskyibacter sp. 2E233 TaxID=3413431 RepID=UPI003BEFEC69
MTKLTKTTLFKDPKPRAETVMDKTTRVVREILQEETKERDTRTMRLRKARLEREAGTPADAAPAEPKKATRKKSPTQTAG